MMSFIEQSTIMLRLSTFKSAYEYRSTDPGIGHWPKERSIREVHEIRGPSFGGYAQAGSMESCYEIRHDPMVQEPWQIVVGEVLPELSPGVPADNPVSGDAR
jgi:hypothetical protein